VASFLDNGSVGVGTTTPWGQLSVNPDGISGPSFVIGSSTATSLIVKNGGNVGIGTAAPDTKLTIGGSADGTDFSGINIYNTSGTINGGSSSITLGRDRSMAKVAGGNDDNTYGNGYLSLYTRASESLSERARITSSGKLGVGVIAPNGKLEVGAANGGTEESFAMSYSSDNSYRNSFYNNFNGDVPDQNWSAFKISTGSNTQAEVMRLIGNGNVGIGTTTPSAKLAIAGTAGTGDIFAVASSTNTNLFTVKSTGNVTMGDTFTWDNANYALKLITPTNSNNAYLAFGRNNVEYGRIGTDSNLWTFKPASGQTFRITDSSAGTNYFKIVEGVGNVAIGTGNNTVSARVHAISTTEQLRLGYDATNYLSTTIGSTGVTTWNAAGTASAFNFTGGNVGVGTTTPYGLLSVNPNGITGPSFVIGSSTATNLIVTNGGNVGIGTASPDYKLKISDTVSSSVGLSISGTAGGSMSLSYSNGAQVITGATTHDVVLRLDNGSGKFYIGSGANARFTMTSAGSIGIGTTTPSAKLSITQSANTNAGGLWIAETGNTDFRSVFMDTSGIMSFYGGDTGGTLNTATLNAAGEWTNASDRTYKDNIEDLSYGLEDLMKLNPRSYTMKNTDLKRVGFIAQEVELIIPEVVAGEEGSKGISYGNLVAVVVKAVQELKIKLDGVLAWFTEDKFSIQNEVCVDDVCVTKEEFKQILLNNGGGYDTEPVSDPEPEPTLELEPEPEPTPEVTPVPDSNIEITPEPEPTLELEPEPEPTPEVMPEIVPEISPEI
jgi:hypothetical protein